MAEPVHWRADGVPRSERFDDIYHTETGALAQARHVFLDGCGLPHAWANQRQWRVLETGFGLGLNFLTSWHAWRADEARPRLLHFVSVEAHPVSSQDLLRAAGAYPELADLAGLLAAQWHGLLPGFHRLAFDEGRVLLTLCIGDVKPMLRAQHFEADSIFLDGFSPQSNPDMWSMGTIKAVARFARQGTRLATWTIARALRDALAQCGFQVHKAAGLPPKRDRLEAVFEPTWTVRRRTPPAQPLEAGTCVVIGAGLAGAAVASSLAGRGWQVTVLDAGERPAGGASGLPVGLLAPHVSPDDALLSRLTRAGIRATWQQLAQWLQEGEDWQATGALERRDTGDEPSDARLPAGWSADGPNESWRAMTQQLQEAGLAPDAVAIHHGRAGWVRPQRLIAAWLAQPRVRVITRCHVAKVEQRGTQWVALDAQGHDVAPPADRIVIAAGFDSRAFAPSLPLQDVRGQVAWGHADAACDAALPHVPINGDGHLIAHVPHADGPMWLAGSTFERDSSDTTTNDADMQANLERIGRLHAPAAQAIRRQGAVSAWAGVRCASADRRPLVGPIDPLHSAGPWISAAMGSRGLSFAALCAELLAAQWHGEPLPLPAKLAKALDTRRL